MFLASNIGGLLEDKILVRNGRVEFEDLLADAGGVLGSN